jgi:primase-polymerase (primpol)-like protein/archaellum biogenesis ATPase FlaH
MWEHLRESERMEQYKNIPESLKQVKQWVCFKLEPNEKKGKHDKIPKDPKTGYNAKANDPATWGDFQTAVKAVSKYGFDGIGIEFANGIFGVDLDNVVKDGKLTAEAQDIIKTLDSYTEYSPSGTGIHILCKGSIPAKDRRKGNVEMYSEGRFFTVTGQVVGTQKELQERTAQAAAVHAKYLRREEAPKAANQPQELNLSDNELINKAMSARNGDVFRALWNGNISGYPSASEADLALCNLLAYWTNGNAYRMDALFRQSALYREGKWNKRHGADTYGNMTINKALSDFTPYERTAPGAATPGAVKSNNEHDNNKDILHQGGNDPQAVLRNNLVSYYLEDVFIKDIDKFKSYKDRKTGFKNLDELTGGLYPGLYVIGAISSLGKTTFVHQMGDQLAAMGDHVLFFSLEQSRLEMVTKSLSRITARNNREKAVSAIKIRGGKLTPEVIAAAEEYNKIADRISVIECNFDTNIYSIVEYTKAYMEAFKVKPVVIVDYLQIIPPVDPRQSDKEKVDNIVRGLKKLQSENDLVLFVISSINRQNYLTPIDFESFKESGGIEYTSDVVWGLQLQILNDELFNSEKKIKEKREKVRQAKKAIPREIELVCLKNRYGVSSYSCGFKYDPRFDLFEPDTLYQVAEDFNITVGNGQRL